MPQRYEREIEEILRKAGNIGPTPATRRAPVQERGPHRPWEERRAHTGPRWRTYLGRLSTSGQLLLLSIVLAVGGFVAQFQAPAVGTVLSMAAVGCFIIAYITGLRGPQNLGSERRWRGERVDYSNPGGPSPIEQLRDWWQRRSRR